jgi:hypothetical protein
MESARAVTRSMVARDLASDDERESDVAIAPNHGCARRGDRIGASFCCAARVRIWPFTSASQFDPRPLLVEPDIAIGIDPSRMANVVGKDRGADRASNDADVSSIPLYAMPLLYGSA